MPLYKNPVAVGRWEAFRFEASARKVKTLEKLLNTVNDAVSPQKVTRLVQMTKSQTHGL